jgi:hypothetical protein
MWWLQYSRKENAVDINQLSDREGGEDEMNFREHQGITGRIFWVIGYFRASGKKWVKGPLLVPVLDNWLDCGAINLNKSYKRIISDGKKFFHSEYVHLQRLGEDVEDKSLQQLKWKY